MRSAALTGLALRELWISYRLLALLAVPLVGGIVTALRPEAARDPATLAWGIAGTGVVVSVLAAAGLASERRHGRVAWLALRAVPRSTVLLAWMGALAVPVLLGTTASIVLAWLVFSGGSFPPLDGISFAGLSAAAAATTLEAVAVGLLAGSLAPPVPAAVLAAGLSGAALGAGLLLPVDPGYLPTAGLGLLAQAGSLERPLSAGLQALGLGLAATGMLLATAAAALARVDL